MTLNVYDESTMTPGVLAERPIEDVVHQALF